MDVIQNVLFSFICSSIVEFLLFQSPSEVVSMDFGSSDADLFSQALMMLSDTNAKVMSI